MTNDLKPCPFCGAEAKLTTAIRNNYFPIRQVAYVMCNTCGASSYAFRDLENNGHHILKAIEAWNRRVE